MSIHDANNQGIWDTVNDQNYGVWNGIPGIPGQNINIDADSYSPSFNGSSSSHIDPSLIDQRGRRCRLVCDPPRRPSPRPHPRPYPRLQLIGLTLTQAQYRYPHLTIRPVIIDGRDVPVTQDFRRDRVNVEIRGINQQIVRIVGFY